MIRIFFLIGLLIPLIAYPTFSPEELLRRIREQENNEQVEDQSDIELGALPDLPPSDSAASESTVVQDVVAQGSSNSQVNSLNAAPSAPAAASVANAIMSLNGQVRSPDRIRNLEDKIFMLEKKWRNNVTFQIGGLVVFAFYTIMYQATGSMDADAKSYLAAIGGSVLLNVLWNAFFVAIPILTAKESLNNFSKGSYDPQSGIWSRPLIQSSPIRNRICGVNIFSYDK